MKFGPCIENNCSACCNPVKVNRFFPDDRIPTDEKGEKIWSNPRIAVPADNPDMKLKAYDCSKFDKSTGKCTDHGNHPEICRNTSCIEEGSPLSIDEQYHQTADKKFIEIKK